MLARGKLYSIESIISKTLISNEIIREGFVNVEKINLIENGKKIGINVVIKRNQIINNSLKP